jgi:AcrR family transcriptional regulator
MAPRGRPITITDDELLDAARAEFLERGADATTREIAKRARISGSVIFHRYKTKEDLFRAVLARELVVPPSTKRLPSRAGVGQIADELFDAALGLIELSRRVQPLLQVAAAQPRTFGHLGQYTTSENPARHEMHHLLVRYFKAEIKKGRLRRADTDLLARMFVGSLTQVVLATNAEDPVGVDNPALVRGVIDVLLKGVLAPAGKKRSPSKATLSHRS